MSCIRRIAKTKSLNSGGFAAALFADYCQTALQLKEWPAKSMCHELSTNHLANAFEFSGPNCSKICLFGSFSSGNCTCQHGYWGESCSNVCPGGATNPCFGHGYCSKENGKCYCDTNWKGDGSCSSCTTGFHGPDCLIALQKFEAKMSFVSKIFANNFLQTFDNVFVAVKSHGEYIGFKIRRIDLSVNLRFAQRFRSVALIGVAVQIKESILVIHAGVSNHLTATVNNKVVHIQDRIALTNGYEFIRLSHDHISIRGSNGLDISIYNRSLSLSVDIKASGVLCSESIGFFGSCKPPVTCDRTANKCNSLSSYNTSELTAANIEEFSMQWKVPTNSSLFTNILGQIGAPLYQTNAQMCLMFDRTGLVTPKLRGVFVSRYASIQLMIKVVSPLNAGSVISFAYNTTLSIVLNGTIWIHREDMNIDTGLTVKDNVWTQLSIVYQRLTGVLQVFTKSDIGLAQSSVYFVGFGWLQDGLSMGIGISKVSTVAAVSLSFQMFSGWIDDVKIWNRRLDSVTIDAHWKSDVGVHDPNLKARWKMDEGTGMTIHDSVGSNNISMPPSGWILPRWVNADYEIRAASQLQPRRKQGLKSAAESKCKDLLYDEAVEETCKTVLVNSTSVYVHACVEKVLAEDDIKAADESLSSYSRACMNLLNLTTNPAQHLCNVVASKRIDSFYGLNCSQKCAFGDVIGGKCTCFKGYWGVNCSSECPGGAGNPCHNHGICLQDSGKCTCEYNWRGDATCSKCTVGWIAPSCLRVESPAKTLSSPVCSITSSGTYRGFDGIQQSLSKGGHYMIINSTKVQVYAATVECFKDAICAMEVKICRDLHEVSFRKIPSSLKTQIIVNERQVDISTSGYVHVSSAISITASSPESHRIKDKDLTIDIKSNGFYYSFSIQSQRPACNQYSGLCGSCSHGTPSKALPMSALQSSYYGQYSLYLNKATMYTKEINIFSDSQTTIEFIIKSCDPKICGGPIITYASRRTVYISNYLTLKLFIGDDAYDSGIQTTVNEWNHVIITCSKLLGKIDIFVALSTTKLYHRSFELQAYPFTESGLISVGSWTPSRSGLDKQPFRTFTGEIEEIRVWDRYFDYSMVRQRVFSNINRPVPGLKAAWQMNEGSGYIVKDLIGGSDMFLPEYPLGRPLWRISTAQLASPLKRVSFVDDTAIRVDAEKFCQDIMLKGHIGSVCTRIEDDVKQFFVSNCIREIVITQRKSASLKVIVEYSDLCKETLSLYDWPARPLCNLFNDVKFPNWIGTNCSVNCVFGNRSYQNPNLCVCDNGYWGRSCNKTCDGGFSRPCSNHGICDQKTGRCTCESNWEGDRNCSTCSNGFTGDDCSVAIAIKFSQSTHAFVSLQGYVTLFGGYGIVLKETGEYRLVYASEHHVSVYGRFVRCFESDPCLNSLVFRFSKTEVVLHAPYKVSGDIKVWLNKKIIDIYINRGELQAHNIRIVRRSPSLYSVLHSLGVFTVSVVDTYLTLGISVNEKICNSSYGMLGNCQKNASEVLNMIAVPLNCSNNAFTEFIGKMNMKKVAVNESNIDLFAKRHMIQLCESSFVYKYEDIIEYRDANAGHALKFNASSLVLLNSTNLNNRVCSFDFMVNIEQDGTILSYGSDTTFLLVTVGFELQLWIGYETYRTGLYVEQNAWNQVVLQWVKAKHQFTIFLIDHFGVLRWRRVDMKNEVDILHHEGVFGIGQWQPAFNNSYTKPNSTFIGLIEQFRIWEKEFSPAVVWQLWSRELRNDSKYLIAKIDFDNVEEDYVIEEVSKSDVRLVNKPWTKPVKVLSGVVQKSQLGLNKERNGDTDWIGMVNAFCMQYIVQGPLKKHCGALGSGIAMFYYRLCVEMASEKGALYIGLHAVISYSDYCQITLNTTFWPARDLCGSFDMVELPKRLQEHCSESCLYGAIDSRGMCNCIKGYWGKRCDMVCPGGAFEPCNNKGVCNINNGTCKCKVNWNGDESCGKCASGWLGTDCRIAQIGKAVIARTDITQAFMFDGTVMLFSGYVIAFNYIGQYWLYRDSVLDIYVQIWQTPCYAHKLCISAVWMRFSKVSIVITSPKPDKGKEIILINDKPVKITSEYLIAGNNSISLRYAAKNEVTVTLNSIRFAFVRILERSLSILIEKRSNDCLLTGGILRTCMNETGNLTATDLAQMLHHAWRIQQTDNIIGIANEIYAVSAAEYALLIENTGAVSNPLCHSFNTTEDYTIEFLVKPMSSQFIIMSYSLANSFAVYADNTFKIITASIEFDTRIKANNGSWQHLTIMYWSELKQLDFYVFENGKILQRRRFALMTHPFFACGIMAIGQWLPSTSMPKGPGIANGRFYIDEMRIWNRAFDPLTVQQNYKMNILMSHPHLKALWKMNEFDGNVLCNLKNIKEGFYLPNTPWQRPSRVISTADIDENITDIFSAALRDNATSAEEHCKTLFYESELWTKCNLIPSVLAYFYSICINDVAMKNTSFAVHSIITFADTCQILLNLTTWPAMTLCHHFTDVHFPRWIGSHCKLSCLFGRSHYLNASQCVCDEGYWGEDCSQKCPGGALLPCSGHGKCIQNTGNCLCELNWSGDVNCSTCGNNWLGPFCNVSTEPFNLYKERSFAISFVTSSGQITTFNGYTVSLKMAKEIILVHNTVKSLMITAKFSPCSVAGVYHSLCLTYLTIRHYGLSVVIRTPYFVERANPQIITPLLIINNKLVKVDHITYISDGTIMKRVRRNVYALIATGVYELRIMIRQRLDVFIKVSRENCATANGILGSCDAARESFVALSERLSITHPVTSSDSIIDYNKMPFEETASVHGGLYGVYLNDTGMISTPFVALNNPVVTIELFLKTVAHGGTLLSYVGQSIFAVSNEGNMRVFIGRDVINTGLSTDVGK